MMPTLHIADRPESPDFDTIVRRIDEISTLPQIALQVMEVADNENSGAADLKLVMECDPALSARVLRCVNSSAYALRSRITNLQQAIAFLGTKQIRNLAMVAIVSDMFKTGGEIGSYRRANLWRHLVAVGVCARLIAMRLGYQNFEEMFLGGLLHDVGIILEDQHLHAPFCAMIEGLDAGKTLMENEHKHLGFDHTRLGAKVAENWGFPEATLAAIRYHHAAVAYRGASVEVVRCVEVANVLCTLKEITSVGEKLLRWSKNTFADLGLTKEDIVVLAEDLDLELAENQFLLQMGGGDHDKRPH
jgi:putative nucleotidyltransferase with HDIG domain